jgi:isopentenyl-diphosphate delta-isomerase
MEQISTRIIVKEVGQGMGKASLKALMQLPLEAIEFAAHGGNNFARLELLRSQPEKQKIYQSLANIGHSVVEMVDMVNTILKDETEGIQCRQFILSGGIKDFLDGYYAIEKIQANAVYGQASTLLKYAEKSYDELRIFLKSQIEGLKLAKAFLKVR